jgi:hypothetical protein
MQGQQMHLALDLLTLNEFFKEIVCFVMLQEE